MNIYLMYIRSILEQSCVVWHHSITKEENEDLEKVQGVACKIRLQEDYLAYEQALEDLGIQLLSVRRDAMCLSFAKKCTKLDKVKNFFPLNTDKKNKDKYQVQFASTSRLLKSAIPQLQRALNRDACK